MATVEDCRSALDTLAATLAGVTPELRARHVPARTVVCRITDLGVVFCGRLDKEGVHDVRLLAPDERVDTDVRAALSSDELVALAAGEEDFLHAWLRGRVAISASVRDLLRLRSLFGL